MNKELKKAILVFILDNEKEFQIVNRSAKEFRQYIYTDKGEYCYGGEAVLKFIREAANLLTEN